MQVELTRTDIHVICSELGRSVENNPKTEYDKTVKRLYLALASKVTDNA